MANRIELDVGGKYSAAAMFKQLNTDVKNVGKAMKDVGGAMTNVANTAANAFDTKMNGALKSSIGLIGEMARGGIWGAVASVTSMAIGFIVDKWNEAKEAAKKYAEICRNNVVETMKGLGEKFNSLGKQMQDAAADAKELLAVTNGEIAKKAEMKVHQLNIQTLQQITDDMSAASRSALLATAALEAAKIREAAADEQAENATRAAAEQQRLSTEKRKAAEERLSQAQAQRAEFEETAKRRGTGWLAKYEELQTRAGMSMEELMANGMALETALKFRKGAALALAQFEEEHKDEVQSLNEVTKLEAVAKSDLESAKREETSASRALAAAQQNETAVHWATTEQVEQAKQRMYDANAALDKENLAREEATRAKEREAKMQLVIDKIKADAVEKDVDYTEWVELATKALQDGYSAETTINIVRARYKAAMEEAAKQKEEEAKGGGAKGSSGNSLTKSIKDALDGIEVNTNVNTGQVGDGIDSSNEVLTLGGLQREVRNDQRKMRDHTSAMKQSSGAMQKYLKGEMSKEVAEKFQQKMKANGLTMKDFGTMTKDALKAQLLSHSQAVEQQKAILDMKKALEKLGLK